MTLSFQCQIFFFSTCSALNPSFAVFAELTKKFVKCDKVCDRLSFEQEVIANRDSRVSAEGDGGGWRVGWFTVPVAFDNSQLYQDIAGH